MNDPSDSQLDALLARLGRDIAPTRDLWPQIEARASVPQFHRRRAWQLAAGIAAVTVIATFALHVADRAAAKVAGPALQDESYLRASLQLEQSYRAQLDQLPPDTRLQIGHDLDVIRSARADIRRALASDPSNPLLNELLATTWQQEMDLWRNL
ncbi:MAG TPA: hypothetical protein VK727_21435 [Steroidobacteraceae bacterium]|nr:hypothetical protein [Steroidobacteraceae bacterium]